MSTAVVPQPSSNPQNNAPTSPSPAPAGGSAAPPPPPATSPVEWRVPDTDPRVWARGKTAEELLGLSTQLYNTVESVVQTGRVQQQPTNQPPAPTAPAIADDAYLTGADFARLAPQAAQQYFAPQLQQMQANIAQANIEAVKRDPQYAPIFAKYGPEVWNKLANVDKSVLNVDNVRTIVNLVKADHVDEIASDLASQRISEMQPTFRSTGAAPAPVSSQQPDLTLKSERLSPEFRERLAAVKMTESALDDFCRANDMSREQFFKMAESKGVITEGGR